MSMHYGVHEYPRASLAVAILALVHLQATGFLIITLESDLDQL